MESQRSLVDLIRFCEWDSVMDRLKTEWGKKEASQKTYPNLKYPIYWACLESDLPLKVLNALLDAYPDGIQQLDNHEKELPIHLAAGLSPSVDVVQRLIGAYHEGLQQKNEAGYLPIHLAALINRSVDVVQILIDGYPRGLQQKARNGGLPIHEAFPIPWRNIYRDMSLGVVQRLCEAYPEGLRQQNNEGELPIHRALKSRTSTDIVVYLIEAYPAGLRQKDSDGELPIHIASRGDASDDVIMYLIEGYPDGLQQRDRDGMLPIHRAAKDNRSADVVLHLIEGYPDGLKQRNRDGMLPIHIASRRDASDDVVLHLLEGYPDGLQQRDRDGMLPIHHLLLCSSISLYLIDIFLEDFPMSSILTCAKEVVVEDHCEGDSTKEFAVVDDCRTMFSFGLKRKTKTQTQHLTPSALCSYDEVTKEISRHEELAYVMSYLELVERMYILELVHAAVGWGEIEKHTSKKRKAEVLTSGSSNE